MKSAVSVFTCALALLGCAQGASDDADSSAPLLLPSPAPPMAPDAPPPGVAGSGAQDAWGAGGAGADAFYGDALYDEGAYFNQQLVLDRGRLDGRLGGVSVEGGSDRQMGWVDGWRDPWSADAFLTLEIHAQGTAGAAMLILQVDDVVGLVAALSRTSSTEATAAPDAPSGPEVQVTGCSGPALDNYPYDVGAHSVDAKLTPDADDPDLLMLEVAAEFEGRDALVGSLPLSRERLLPLLQRALDP